MEFLEAIPIESVRPCSWNINAITEKEREKLKAGMKAAGPEKMDPIIVRRAEDGSLEIIDGEQRWAIAKELGWKTVSVVLMDVDRREAKYLTISYNALRGTIDYTKLVALAASDPEMYEAAVRVFGEDEVKKLIKSWQKISNAAKEELQKVAKTESAVSPKLIETIAQVPSDLQARAVDAIKKIKADEIGKKYIQAAFEMYERGEGEEKEAEEEEVEAREEEIFGKAQEIAIYIEIPAPGTYLVSVNLEKREIDVRPVNIKEVEGRTYQQLEHIYGLPKLYEFKISCKCGRRLVGTFDASSGEYRLREETGERKQ